MKRATILFTALWLTLGAAAAGNPKADPRAVVEAGNARFTVLTPQLIRMEWSEDGRFEDRATLTFVNRETPVPDFKVRDTKSRLTITTPALTLTYTKGGKFSDKNLKAVFRLNGREVVWTPGTEDPQNLMGTTRTLDGCDGRKLGREPMEQGLLSRAGWSVVDDSGRHVLTPDGSAWKEWVEARPAGDRQDLYLFAYGHDYKQALADFQLVAGRAPLPPKYTFGYWWSRYWQYSDNEFVDLVQKLKSVDIPIDVLIVDMDWHETWGLRKKNPAKDEYGQRIGWTGYTWQKELFPSPANFLRWTENEQLKVALNLHPASGIQPYEDVYEPFTREYGWTEKGKSVPFHIDEQKWADAYFKTVLNPMERQGVDFWWLDWQQWMESKFTPGLSNTFWLNYTFFHHAEQQNPALRPFIYHRWGGLGSHRYPLAFSGDTYAKWETLAFLPYFTATSSNVNYGYWGHDIGGHMFKKETKATDPELYTRWLQYGVFTPIFKTHSTKDPRIERYLWFFPDHLFVMRDAIRLRYTLAPYVYNAARENYDTGVGMCRPMYYDHPERDEAYNVPEQFMFGNDILATAVVEPVDSVTGLAARRIWFPEGRRTHRGAALHPLGKSLVRAGRSHPSDEPTDGEKPPAALRHAGADLHPRGRRRACPLRGRRRQPAVRHGLRHHEGHQEAGGQHPARRRRAPRRHLRRCSRQPQLRNALPGDLPAQNGAGKRPRNPLCPLPESRTMDLRRLHARPGRLHGRRALRPSAGGRADLRRPRRGAPGRPLRQKRSLQTLHRPDRRIQDRTGQDGTLPHAAQGVPQRLAVPQFHSRRPGPHRRLPGCLREEQGRAVRDHGQNDHHR